jgi:hypothetical protein
MTREYLHEPAVFMKEPVENWWFYGQLFNLFMFLRSIVMHQNRLFDFSETCGYESQIPP